MAATCDVVVVGGGIAGVSVGYELAAHRRVVLVEAERDLATKATGRSAAMYLPSYGNPTVRALTRASGSRFGMLGERFGVGPPLTPRPVLWAGFDQAGLRAVRTLLDEAGTLEELSPDKASLVCPWLAPGVVMIAALDRDAADIGVMGLLHGYARGLRTRGGTVLTGAPVTAIARRGTGWRVTAGAHVLDCHLIVDAAGAWADRVARLAGVGTLGLQPKRRTLCVCPVPPDVPLEPHGMLLADATERFYLRPAGDSVLVSPADADPRRPADPRPDGLAIARAIVDINRVTRLDLRTVGRSWAGLRTFTPDGGPVAGCWPDQPGFAFLAGQGGYGIQMAPALAALTAAVLTGQPVPADIEVDPRRLTPARR
jgi:D-arginine dehydrogenase